LKKTFKHTKNLPPAECSSDKPGDCDGDTSGDEDKSGDSSAEIDPEGVSMSLAQIEAEEDLREEESVRTWTLHTVLQIDLPDKKSLLL
jgi:hypothetical protein